jgi:hypothetical protein
MRRLHFERKRDGNPPTAHPLTSIAIGKPDVQLDRINMIDRICFGGFAAL